MDDNPNEDDPNTNNQLREIFFIKSQCVFHINSTNKKSNKFIASALINTKAYESYFNKCNPFALTFHFLTPKERDLHCSHEIKLRTKPTHS